MAYLKYISDENLLQEVKFILDKTREKHESIEKAFNKNVIDPFGALFESPAFQNHDVWKNAEMARQCQKAIQNHIGQFHQKILGHVDSWKNAGTGGIIDLISDNRKIIAEIKNKHNTVKGSDLVNEYKSLDSLITPKISQYKNYTAYFVTIIPKKAKRMNKEFTPPDNEKGMQCPPNPHIRIIDGASFYELATGRKFALKELHTILPNVIQYIYANDYGENDFKLSDLEAYSKYFQQAYNE